jgi:hypothetical protein
VKLNGSMTEWKLSDLLTGGYKIRVMGSYPESDGYSASKSHSVGYNVGTVYSYSKSSSNYTYTSYTVNSDGSLAIMGHNSDSSSTRRYYAEFSNPINLSNVDAIIVEYEATSPSSHTIEMGIVKNYDYVYETSQTPARGDYNNSSEFAWYARNELYKGTTGALQENQVDKYMLLSTSCITNSVYLVVGFVGSSTKENTVTFKHIYLLKSS